MEEILKHSLMEFISDLKTVLKQVIVWSEEFNKGKKDYSFDIDNELYIISKRHDRDFKQGDLSLIYSLVDFYCDAIKHEFKEIDRDYSVKEAYEDIVMTLENLDSNSFQDLALSEELRIKLKKLSS